MNWVTITGAKIVEESLVDIFKEELKPWKESEEAAKSSSYQEQKAGCFDNSKDLVGKAQKDVGGTRRYNDMIKSFRKVSKKTKHVL